MFPSCAEVCLRASSNTIIRRAQTDNASWRIDIVRWCWQQLFHACMSRHRCGLSHKHLANEAQAITEMTRQLRAGKGKNGLILANGGLATYQAVLCLSSSPRRDGLPYPNTNPLPETISDVQVPPVDAKADGEGIVEVS